MKRRSFIATSANAVAGASLFSGLVGAAVPGKNKKIVKKQCSRNLDYNIEGAVENSCTKH